MILLILLIAGLIGGAILSVWIHYNDGGSPWWNILTIPFFSAMGAGVGFLAFAFLGLFFVGAGTDGERVYGLAALGDDSQIEGHFFLGSGTVDEKLVFNYIAIQEDGGYTLESVKASEVVVYEDATPETATYVDRIRYIDAWWWAGEGHQSPVIDDFDDEFHIPEGSIDNTYKVSVTD